MIQRRVEAKRAVVGGGQELGKVWAVAVGDAVGFGSKG